MIGFDCGTYNLVVCTRDKDGKFVYKREVNAFLEMPIDNRFVFNMMKKAGVPLVERPEAGVAYALGEAAVDMAYTMSQIELKRPMRDGCLNPKEKNAQQLLSIMMHGLISDKIYANEPVYYSVPANALNEETDAEYHGKVLEAILKAYKDDKGSRLAPFPINEALAIVYSELAGKNYTGLACSFGSGMVNVCFAIYGSPVFQFSIVNSGDWIDKMAAKATGESVAFINKEKTKINFNDYEQNSLVHRAIKSQYEIMIQKTVSTMKKGLENIGNKARTDGALDVVVAGGTSLPEGFDRVFGEILKEAKLSIDIGNVIRPADPLYAVARGCLIAAEVAN